MLLDHLHPLLKIDYDGLKNSGSDMAHLGATEENIIMLKWAYPTVPKDYLDIITQIDGVGLHYKNGEEYIFDLYILSSSEATKFSVEWYPYLGNELPGCSVPDNFTFLPCQWGSSSTSKTRLQNTQNSTATAFQVSVSGTC